MPQYGGEKNSTICKVVNVYKKIKLYLHMGHGLDAWSWPFLLNLPVNSVAVGLV